MSCRCCKLRTLLDVPGLTDTARVLIAYHMGRTATGQDCEQCTSILNDTSKDLPKILEMTEALRALTGNTNN